MQAAKRRVHIERAAPNGTAMRVTVEGVRLQISRAGERVTERRVSPTVVVATPVLLLHDRVSAHQRRLNAGLAKPGLSQRLTARLYQMAWTRGYAQCGGAPIENVVANRHVALATNGALLGVQRQSFGRSDPGSRRALTEATAVTGISDLVLGSRPERITEAALSEAQYRPPVSEIKTIEQQPGTPGPATEMAVDANRTARAAFREVAAPAALNETLTDAYTGQAKLVVDRTQTGGGTPRRPSPPGPEWELVADRTRSDAEVVGTSGTELAVPAGWHRFASFGRVVEIDHTRIATWRRGPRRVRTISRATERNRVEVGIVGRHRGQSPAPARPMPAAHDGGAGPLDGPNLAGVEATARDRLVGEAGGPGSVALAAAEGTLETEPVSIEGAQPAGLREWVYRDIAALRERVGATTVHPSRGAVGTFEANPARRLRQNLSRRRADLVSAPAEYDSAAERARIAAPVAFLVAVDRRLQSRAADRTSQADRVGEELESVGGSLQTLRRGLTARESQRPRASPPPTGIVGPVRLRVDTRAQYLTRAELEAERFPAVEGAEHPLVTRNVNAFTVPYGTAADGIVGELTPSGDRVSLASAAGTLAASRQTAEQVPNESVERSRRRLRQQVSTANSEVAAQLVRELRRETDLGARESQQVVAGVTREYGTVGARGLALANGSVARQVARRGAVRAGLGDAAADWLRIQLLGALQRSLETPAARPQQPAVNETATAVRDVAEAEASRYLKNRARDRLEDVAEAKAGASSLPAGLPVASPVTNWIATVNIWWISARGEYARFAVSAAHGRPDTPGGRTTYVRDGDPVTWTSTATAPGSGWERPRGWGSASRQVSWWQCDRRREASVTRAE